MIVARSLRKLAFGLAMLSIALSLTVSANLLYVAGIDYAQPGGNPLVKIHPATWMLLGSFACLVFSHSDPVGALIRMLRAEPALAWFLALMMLTVVYSVISVGASGVAVYVESYLSAGLLALLARQFTEGGRRLIGLLALGLIACNAGLAIGETIAQVHLVPIYLEETALVDEPGAFRSSALFDHPLTGAMLAMTGMFTTLAFRPRLAVLAPVLVLLGVALLAFGGRAALGVTLVALLGASCRTVGRDLLHQRLRLRRAVVLAAGAIIVPAAVVLLVPTTGIGGRIAAKLYLDDSAQSRGAEWLVLGLLDTRAWLFGTPIADTPGLIYRIGLDTALTDIENFWLLAFLNLGLVGFTIFAVGLTCLLRHLWQVTSRWGRLSIVALILTASTSNSLGRKSNVLFILTACVEATACTSPARTRRPSPLGLRPTFAGVRA